MLTLLENVMLPMDFGEVFATAEREARAAALLDLVGLGGLEHKYPAAVSGGQQQSAAVARALANDPPILVADEPTGNLDSRTAERVLEIFEEQVAQGKTVLMVTHDINLARRAQRVLVISDGELVNEWISRALPGLPHDMLLHLSQAARPRQMAAGEVLERLPERGLIVVGAQPGQPGRLEVVVTGRLGTQVVAGQLEPGDFISSEDARLLGRSLVGLRAAGAGEVLWLDGLPPSPELDQALAEAAPRRAAQYREAGRQRGRRGLLPCGGQEPPQGCPAPETALEQGPGRPGCRQTGRQPRAHPAGGGLHRGGAVRDRHDRDRARHPGGRHAGRVRGDQPGQHRHPGRRL